MPPEPVPSERLPSAATDSTLPSFSSGAEIALVVAVAVDDPTVLRITPDDSLTTRAVLNPDSPDDAVANSTVPKLSSSRAPVRLTVNWLSDSVLPAGITVAPPSVHVPPLHVPPLVSDTVAAPP